MIITKTFQKDFKKIFKAKENLELFTVELSKSKLINLKKPYKKYKFCIIGNAIRGIIQEYGDKSYIPLMVVKKSNKKYGMNLGYSLGKEVKQKN